MVPTREIATPLAKVGWQQVWSPIEDTVLRFGGPRVGKSGELACRILDAPGAVIATSTRVDLLDLTCPLRERRGPVWIFNPSGVGDLPSTVVFDPLAGCEVPKVAHERARDLVAGGDAGVRGPHRRAAVLVRAGPTGAHGVDARGRVGRGVDARRPDVGR